MRIISNQEIFNSGWQRFIVNEEPLSIDDSDIFNQPNRCMYRGPYGTKCLIGGLIPDEAYDPSMEDSSALELEGLPFKFQNRYFAANAQKELHDRLQHVDFEDRKERYKAFANRYGLTIPGEEDGV